MNLHEDGINVYKIKCQIVSLQNSNFRLFIVERQFLRFLFLDNQPIYIYILFQMYKFFIQLVLVYIGWCEPNVKTNQIFIDYI